MILAIAILVAALTTGILTFAPFVRQESWKATVTPLASIIGSGFLVCAPLLAHEFGILAAPAMAVLLILAYVVGSVIRFNIKHVEPYLANAEKRDSIAWLARLTQVSLSFAYAISVAYYLKLLAAFVLQEVPGNSAALSNWLVTGIIAIFTILPFTGGLRKVEHLAQTTVSIKLGIIAGILVALAIHWISTIHTPMSLPPVKLGLQSVPLLLGLLITVQGFETSRYLGHTYPAEMRIRTMRNSQWISSAIYLAFLILLTPFLSRAATTHGVAGILDVMKLLSPGFVAFVLIGAVTSQLSAAIADSIGASGIVTEISREKLNIPMAYALSSFFALTVVWLTNPLQIIALASRAFAVYYSLQCVLGFTVSRKTATGSKASRLGLCLVGAVCLIAALAGTSAE